MKFLTSMKSKMILSFLLITLIPIIVLGLFFSNNMEKELEKNFADKTIGEIEQVDEAVGLYFKGIDENTNYLANLPTVKQADDTITTYMDKTNPNGDSVPLNASENGGIEAEIYSIYENFAQTHPESPYVYMATVDGGYVQWPEDSTSENYDPRDRPYYQQAMENEGDTSRTSAYYFAPDDSTIVSTVTTINDESGNVVGVQGLDVSLDGLTDMVSDIKVGENGYVMLLEEDGTILANPNNPDTSFQNITDLDIPQLHNIQEVQDEMIEGNVNGEPHLINVYTSPETGWKFVAVQQQSELAAQLTEMNTLILIISIIFAVIAAIVAYFLANRFSTPILNVVGHLQTIADGDFTETIPDNLTKRNDELGVLANALQTTQSSVRSLLNKVKESALSVRDSSQTLAQNTEQTSQSTNEIATAINQVALGATEQAEHLEDGESSLQQLNEQIDKVSRENETINEQTNTMKELKDSGLTTVEELIKKSNETRSSTEDMSHVIGDMDKLSEEIGNFSTMIIDITEQTNLLALNASIEAARAGEYGKGFAVVADEIRKLADQSASAAEQIKTTIGKVQSQSKQAVSSIEQTKVNTYDNEEKVNETKALFNELASIIQTVTENTAKVANYSNAMIEKREQITDVIQSLSASSQEAASSSEEVSASTEEQLSIVEELNNHSNTVKELAETLQQEIERFKI
ncbi:methyl-accepting chemotaxis protein [Aquibacillus sediminis]|uniref:methyl-accepting chemotaxis protein n=1 Tax=Aquibacillus sediminis TaxID=2574734 RepID=UPI0011095141|nr:methyl-accepting chemotaxis protein [Aquibacillus sediminis]